MAHIQVQQQDQTRIAFEQEEAASAKKQRQDTIWIVVLVISWVIILLFAGLLGYYAYEATHKTNNPSPPQPGAVCMTPACVSEAAAMLASANLSANPCSNLYNFTCGSYSLNNDIPPEEVQWNPFQAAAAKAQKTVIFQLSQPLPPNSSAPIQSAQIFWNLCNNPNRTDFLAHFQQLMNATSWNSNLTSEPVADWDIIDQDGFAFATAILNTLGISTLFQPTVIRDPVNSTLLLLTFQPGDTIIPGGYTSPAEIQGVMDLLSSLWGLMGLNATSAQDLASDVVKLDVLLMAMREGITNHTAQHALRTDLHTFTPSFSWSTYFFAYLNKEFPSSLPVVIYPTYLEALEQFFGENGTDTFGSNNVSVNSQRVWQAWTLSHLLVNEFMLLGLPTQFLAAYQTFNPSASKPTSALCLTNIDALMPFITGRIFLDKSFNKASRGDASTMAYSIANNLRDNLQSLPWETNVTRLWAVVKVNLMTYQVGYPDWFYTETFTDYHSLLTYELAEYNQSFYNSLYAAMIWSQGMMQDTQGETWDPAVWTPTSLLMADARYTLDTNTLFVSPSILQPPFYNLDFPSSINYGAIGQVMGHELIHGFDLEGLYYDADGLPQDPPAEVVANFNNLSQCYVQQYDKFSINTEVGALFVNGTLTQYENGADIGGIKIAFQTWKKGGKPAITLPGFETYTQEQLFFIAFGQIYCSIQTADALVQIMDSSPYALGQFRVQGCAQSSDDFTKAYECASANNTCHLW